MTNSLRLIVAANPFILLNKPIAFKLVYFSILNASVTIYIDIKNLLFYRELPACKCGDESKESENGSGTNGVKKTICD